MNLRNGNDEMCWIVSLSKVKGWRDSIINLAATKTIYGIRRYRNDRCFGISVDNTEIVENIIDMIVYRGWYNERLRSHIAKLMM